MFASCPTVSWDSHFKFGQMPQYVQVWEWTNGSRQSHECKFPCKKILPYSICVGWWTNKHWQKQRRKNIWISHTKFSTGDKEIEHSIAYARDSFIQHFKMWQKQRLLYRWAARRLTDFRNDVTLKCILLRSIIKKRLRANESCRS